jgi:hypothetical protein
MRLSYEQARKDYELLVSIHDSDVDDITGGFVFEEHAMVLLRNPSKSVARDLYVDLIRYGASAGFTDPVERDSAYLIRNDTTEEIFERYNVLPDWDDLSHLRIVDETK